MTRGVGTRRSEAERLYHLAMSTLETRREQMFPKLSPEEIARLRRFGTVRRYRAGEPLFRTGEISPGMFVIVSGTVAITRREGLERVVPIVEVGPGDWCASIIRTEPTMSPSWGRARRVSPRRYMRRPRGCR
jgi:CRP-like cAMP-binding protein